MKHQISDVILKEIKGLWGDEPMAGDSVTPVIKTNNMTYEGYINYSDLTMRHIEKSKLEKGYLLKGDLLIEKSGGTKYHSVGYVNFFDGENDKYVCNNFVLALRPNATIIRPKYLFHQLKYKYESGKFADCYNKTTGIQNLQVKTYLSKRVLVPSFGEQDRVIKTLDDITTNIHVKQNQLNKLDSLVKSRFMEMFGNVATHESLSSLTTKITDGSHLPPKGIDQSEYLMLSSQNVHNELSLEGVRYLSKEDFEKENQRTDIQPNDVLLTIVGTIGRTHVVKPGEKYVFQRSVGVIKPMCSKLDGTYLANYLQTPTAISQLESGGHGSSQKGIYLQDLKKLQIPVAEFAEQKRFASFVELIDKSRFIVQSQIKDLQELLDSKMDEYFGGDEG